jgi:hypothetical protein
MGDAAAEANRHGTQYMEMVRTEYGSDWQKERFLPKSLPRHCGAREGRHRQSPWRKDVP